MTLTQPSHDQSHVMYVCVTCGCRDQVKVWSALTLCIGQSTACSVEKVYYYVCTILCGCHVAIYRFLPVCSHWQLIVDSLCSLSDYDARHSFTQLKCVCDKNEQFIYHVRNIVVV